MGADQNTAWAAEMASALEWWRDAGVDMLVQDGPRDWMAAAVPAIGPLDIAPARAQPALPAEATAPAMPDDLAAFLAWRTGAAAPEADWGRALVAPTGAEGVALMIVTDMPDADAEEGALLSPAAARLFDRMLAAIGRTRADVALTALALARPRGGRLPEGSGERLAVLLRHHLALARPRRVLLMGNEPSRALLAMNCLQARGTLHAVNHGGGTSEIVASLHPRLLLERPAQKAEAWKDLQLLIRGLS